MKRKISRTLKKAAAAASASVLVFSMPATASAEGVTYCDREKEALKAASAYLAEDWDQSLETSLTQSGSLASNAVMDLNLTVDEAGRSMLGMLTGMDLSWLQDVALHMNASVADSKEAVMLSALVNDSTICSMYAMMDYLAGMEYIQIPEMSPAYLKASLEEAGAEAVSGYMTAISDILEDPKAVLPEGAVLGEILDRYGMIVIDHMQEGASVEETISIDGIGEDCTLLEGQIFQEEMTTIAREILTTAQTDEQIKEILTKCTEINPESGDLNAQFQEFLANTLADLDGAAEETAEDAANEYLASRIWINSDNRIVGREIALCEGVDSQVSLTWKNPQNGDTSGFLLSMYSEGSELALTGNGQSADGVLNGTYSLVADGAVMMDISVENYNSNANGEGYPAGTFTMTFPSGESEEEYNPLSAFSLVADLSSDSADQSVDLKLSVLSSGASLCSLTLHVAASGDGVEAVAEEDMGTVYDLTSEEDMSAYEAEMNFDTIRANAENAGVPAEVIDMIAESMSETEGEVEVLEDVPADDAA